ncbi:MAG: hypothetical protein ACE37H_12840 [Phycisphaeraceae bacterium]
MSESLIFMLMFALGGGNGGDLLDFGSTDIYWQMREQRVIDVATMSEVLDDDDAISADTLMAIRALGELGMVPDADPATKAQIVEKLTPLVDSKEPFVGQYAKRSIAWVKGEDPPARPKATQAQLDADLAILPHTSQVVGQMRIGNGVGPIDWNKLLPDMGENGPDRGEMIGEISGMVAQAAAMIGNARLDAVTVGAQFFGNGDDGYAVILGRGQYDRIGLQIALQDMAEEQGEDSELSFYSIGDIEVIVSKSRWEQFAILMPSDEVFVFMVGESDQGSKMFPIDETADRLAKGDAQLAFSDIVTKQMKQVDRDKAIAWVAMQVPPPLRQEVEEVFGPFEAAHASAVRNDEGDIDVAWKAEGSDAQAIDLAVAKMNEELAEGRVEIREEMARNPELKPMFEPLIKMMDSLHVEAEGKTMTGGIQVPGNIGAVMQMMFMGFARADHVEKDFAAEAVAEEAVLEAADEAAE